MEQQVEDAVDQHRDELLRRLFSGPAFRDITSIISFRDAQDRAERLSTPDEAVELLRRARTSGDELLVTAVALHAAAQVPVSRSWAGVLDDWFNGDPADIDTATGPERPPAAAGGVGG